MADITYSDVQSLAELAVTNRYKVDFTNFTGSLVISRKTHACVLRAFIQCFHNKQLCLFQQA